jgi:Transglutaminase-like superfamily
MAAYFMLPHIYHCWTEDGIVLLDLKRCRYFGLARDQLRSVVGLVPEWQSNGMDVSDAGARSGAVTRAERLVRDRLLTREPGAAAVRLPGTQLPRADEGLLEVPMAKQPDYNTGHLGALALACVRSGLALKWLSLERIVSSIALRRQRCSSALPPAEQPISIRTLAEIFLYLRPLLYTAKERCLFDSLALVDFLSQYQHFPAWVIGVKTQPFGAHSWVQAGKLVLNDTAQHTRAFARILVV